MYCIKNMAPVVTKTQFSDHDDSSKFSFEPEELNYVNKLC